MVRIAPVDLEETEGKVRETLAGVEKMLGATPNLFRTAARAPSALDALVACFGAAARGKLTPRAREAIALVVSEANACDYCLSAHAALGARAGLTPDAIDAARDAASTDPRVASM